MSDDTTSDQRAHINGLRLVLAELVSAGDGAELLASLPQKDLAAVTSWLVAQLADALIRNWGAESAACRIEARLLRALDRLGWEE
jgi:hypothetical protein